MVSAHTERSPIHNLSDIFSLRENMTHILSAMMYFEWDICSFVQNPVYAFKESIVWTGLCLLEHVLQKNLFVELKLSRLFLYTLSDTFAYTNESSKAKLTIKKVLYLLQVYQTWKWNKCLKLKCFFIPLSWLN